MLFDWLPATRRDVRQLATLIHDTETRIMSALADAVTRITTSTKNEIAAVLAALQKPNPDVDAAVTQLNALSDNLDAETAALTPPAPTP